MRNNDEPMAISARHPAAIKNPVGTFAPWGILGGCVVELKVGGGDVVLLSNSSASLSIAAAAAIRANCDLWREWVPRSGLQLSSNFC